MPTIDDSDSAISYSGYWVTAKGGGSAYGNNGVHSTREPGASATIRFTGKPARIALPPV